MALQVVTAGAGLAGLAATLACARAGAQVTVLERAYTFGEVGAGIQIGPNVTRILHGWGLQRALEAVAAYPDRLLVRDAVSGRDLGVLRLGETAMQRYGAPYATVHRADLHAVLLDAVRSQTAAELRSGVTVAGFEVTSHGVAVQFAGGAGLECDLLLGADGVWSAVRRQLLRDGAPRATGHRAYRALVPQADLPESLRSQHITAWLGPDLHVVQYPVRRGEWLNVVAIVQGEPPLPRQRGGADDIDRGGENPWDHDTDGAALRAALQGCCAALRDLVAAVAHWRMWPLCDRPPMQGPLQHGSGRVALLGDAAHPMRPYLAQGAGMAIEDAAELGRVVAGDALDVAAAVHQYGLRRWQRNARVQARAIRNGQIFHAQGWLRQGRDLALSVLGERLLDMPWLYGREA